MTLDQPRPPLGLPRGSVRAILTLLTVAVVVVQVIRDKEVENLWVETLMIVLAYYFTSRRFIHLPAEVIQRLEAEGHVEHEGNPLYLPRHSIRVSLFLTFVGLAIYLYREGRMLEPQALSILGVVFAFLLGVIASAILAWWTKGKQPKVIVWWEDLKAGVVLLVLIVTATAYFLDMSDDLPRHLRSATLGLVLFYFGSR